MNLICPLGSKYFLHRSAFPVLMYNSQKKSKSFRTISAIFDWLEEENNLAEQLYQKYRKSHYRGKPTPLVRKLERLQSDHARQARMIREFEMTLFYWGESKNSLNYTTTYPIYIL